MDDELPPVEDYESLGHTFLGGRSGYYPANPADTAAPEEPREPVQIDWTVLIWVLLGAAVIALGVLAAWVIAAIIHHIHSTQATPAGPPQSGKGRVFAIIVVVVAAAVAARAIARRIRGD